MYGNINNETERESVSAGGGGGGDGGVPLLSLGADPAGSAWNTPGFSASEKANSA